MAAGALLIAVAAISLMIVTSILKKRFEPYIHDAAVRYLQERFDSEVELGSLQIHMPQASTLRLLMTRGRGAVAQVEGSNLSLRHMGRRDIPPMFAIKHFQFGVDLGVLLDKTKRVPVIELEGMEIYVPPKGERPDLRSRSSQESSTPPPEQHSSGVLIEEVLIHNAVLVILPRDESKIPLQFDIQSLRMESVGKESAMKYDAELTNPKPPGAPP